MILDTKPLVEINQYALRLLYKEMGVVDAIRFLRQYTSGFGDYVQERDALFGEKALDEIIAEMERQHIHQ